MAPHIETLFPSKYVKAHDLNGKEFVVQISHLNMESMEDRQGNEETKPVLYFFRTEKALVLNKTNGNSIAEAYGCETDEWAGKLITLFAVEVEAFGERRPAIRVRVTEANKATDTGAPTTQPAASQALPATPAADVHPLSTGDDDLPF